MQNGVFDRPTWQSFSLELMMLGALAFAAGSIWLRYSALPDQMPSVVLFAVMGIAAVAILARRSWVAPIVVFSGTCAIGCLAYAVTALAGTPELTSWVLPSQLATLSIAGLVLRCRLTGGDGALWLTAAGGTAAVMCILFGMIHLRYAGVIETMVPGWIPLRELVPYLTGTMLVAAGCAMIFARTRRLAAAGIAMMFSSWIVVVHLPRVFAKPLDAYEWSFAGMAMSLTGALLILAFAVPAGLSDRVAE